MCGGRGRGEEREGEREEMLRAASDRVTEHCGYSYNDSVEMHYDNRLGLYCDQVCEGGGRGRCGILYNGMYYMIIAWDSIMTRCVEGGQWPMEVMLCMVRLK